jgi:hypothetical protein
MNALRKVFDRLMPALVMAASVTLLTAGLMSYAPPTFGDWQTPEPTIGGGDPLFEESPTPTQPGPPTATPRNPTPSPTIPGPPTPSPTPSLQPGSGGVASRIAIPSLNIDLPVVPSDLVVRGNRDFYPLCDVAMYMQGFVQPGESGSTYIYAHAQRGMFLPLLRASNRNNGASMIGALVEVYTSDNRLHLYEIFRVKRHATDLSLTQVPVGVHQLVLQTSEGVSGTVPKLQVAARPIAVVPATAADANPSPRPRVCLPR